MAWFKGSLPEGVAVSGCEPDDRAPDLPGGVLQRVPKRSIVATAAALFCVIVFVLAQAYPSTEAVRLRNALLIDDDEVSDFNWRPDRAPSGFLQESQPVPAVIAIPAREIAQRTAGGDFEVARALTGHLLAAHVGDKGGIQSLDVAETYHAITADGLGYCSDFVDTFIALALAAGIPVRAWSFSFDGFGGHGHSVAEIFDRQANRWFMLDVFNNLYPVERDTGVALGALDLRERLIADPSSVKFVQIAPGRIGIPIEEKLFEYYRGGLAEWYLLFGNNVVSRGQHPVTRLVGGVFEPLGELHAVARGVYPRIVPLKTSANAPQIARIKLLKRELLSAAVIAVLLGVALVVELIWWLARRAKSQMTRNRAASGSPPPDPGQVAEG